METSEENVCCWRIPCITEMAWFDSVVLNRDVLSLAIRARCDVTGHHVTYSPSSFRKAAYRQYVIWKYGYLGETIVEFFRHVLLGVSEGSTLLQMATTWDSESTGMMNYLCNKCNNITKHFLVLYHWKRDVLFDTSSVVGSGSVLPIVDCRRLGWCSSNTTLSFNVLDVVTLRVIISFNKPGMYSYVFFLRVGVVSHFLVCFLNFLANISSPLFLRACSRLLWKLWSSTANCTCVW